VRGRRLPDTVIDRIPGEVQAGDYWRVLIDDSDGAVKPDWRRVAGRSTDVLRVRDWDADEAHRSRA
jgi:hypothetical protein